MIEKKRLEELIEKGATIYCPLFVGDYIKLNKKETFVHSVDGETVLYVYTPSNCETYGYYGLDILYESKEEAEWYVEFGNIERTEKLTLPTWEEVQNDLEKSPDGDYFIVDNDKVTFIYYKSNGFEVISNCDNYHFFGSTKENYLEACRLAKKLFLGLEDK